MSYFLKILYKSRSAGGSAFRPSSASGDWELCFRRPSRCYSHLLLV